MRVRAVIDPTLAPNVQPDEAAWVTDVLRLASTVVTAFDRGCGRAFLLGKPDGLHLVQTNRPLLTVGESLGEKIAGFDLNNSPTALANVDLSAHDIAILTTNGTGRVLASMGGNALGLFCFLNMQATANDLARRGGPLVLIAAGRRGRPAFEDTLAVGALIHSLALLTNDLRLDSVAEECQAAWLNQEHRIAEVLIECDTGRHLTNLGYAADLAYCARRDISDRVVVVETTSGAEAKGSETQPALVFCRS